MKGGHGILYRYHVLGPAAVILQDPGPFGLPDILTVAHEHKDPAETHGF